MKLKDSYRKQLSMSTRMSPPAKFSVIITKQRQGSQFMKQILKKVNKTRFNEFSRMLLKYLTG